MKNFGRALSLSLRYRYTFLASLFCALMVGILWAGNLGAIYPLVQVAFEKQSFHEGLDAKVDKAVKKSADLRAEIAQLKEQQRLHLTQQEHHDVYVRLSVAEDNLKAEERALGGYRWATPYLHRYVPADRFQAVVLLVGLILLGTVLKSLFLIANTILVGRLAQLGTFRLRKLFYRRSLRMDLATFNNEGTADLMSRFTNDMGNVAMGLNILFGKLVREPLKMIFCLVAAACVCWRLLLLSLVVAPVAALLIRWLAKTLKRANRRAMEEMAVLYNTLGETFQGIKVLKAFTMERQERRRFHSNSKQYYKKSMRIVRYNSLSHPITEMMGVMIICLALTSGAYLVLQGETHLFGIRMIPRPLGFASLAMFYGFLIGAADPARKLSDVFTQLQRAAAASDRVYAMLDREPKVRDPEHPRPLARHHKHLAFEGVGFAYVPGRPVLEDINLKVEFGETVAIVGPNGCGKSTLANLVPRFADPDAGTIRLDGVPLGEVRLSNLRKQIGLVTQEPVLFDDTVLANIRYGSPQATPQEAVQAARQAHAHRFIDEELAHGYDTPVGPMGNQLSGGQRQRIALARAILRNPAILILDEATSQIDLQSEQLIQKVLEQFVRDRTTLIITHRLGTLSLADRIVVMQERRIVDLGTHDDLIARCPFYRRLYQIQFDGLRETA